jgi:hypothetical protein
MIFIAVYQTVEGAKQAQTRINEKKQGGEKSILSIIRWGIKPDTLFLGSFTTNAFELTKYLEVISDEKPIWVDKVSLNPAARSTPDFYAALARMRAESEPDTPPINSASPLTAGPQNDSNGPAGPGSAAPAPAWNPLTKFSKDGLTLDDLVGQEDIRTQLSGLFSLSQKPGHILITAPSGMGKATIAQAAAGAFDLPLFVTEARSLMDLAPAEFRSVFQTSFGDTRQGVLVIKNLHELLDPLNYGPVARFTLNRFYDCISPEKEHPLVIATFDDSNNWALPDVDRYFEHTFSLKPYTSEQLAQIFARKAAVEKLICDEKAIDAVRELIKKSDPDRTVTTRAIHMLFMATQRLVAVRSDAASVPIKAIDAADIPEVMPKAITTGSRLISVVPQSRRRELSQR